MGFLLRADKQTSNPTLAGGVYYDNITIGTPVYERLSGSEWIGIIFLCDGGKYGLDDVQSFEYKGGALTETTQYIFHRGTIPKQVVAKTVTVDTGTNFFTSTAHGYSNDDPVRLRSVDGNLPVPLEEGILGQSKIYYIRNKTDDTFQLGLTAGGAAIDITNAGSGTLKVWKADAGFDDPEQGLPEFAPEVESTFNNIAYIEFKKNFGSTDPLDWQDFRTFLRGRRLMDYDEDGNELGVISGDDTLGNIPLQMLDNLFWNYKIEESRIDFASWKQMRDDAEIDVLQRIKTDETSIVTGLTGRYFQGTDGHPVYPAFTQQIVSRLDANINIPSTAGTIAPIAGVDPSGFTIIWKGRIKPEFTELYTLKVVVDNSAQVWINGNLLIDTVALGATTATYSFVADTLYEIEFRFKQNYAIGGGNLYQAQFYWSSASQPEEIVPTDRLFPSDDTVKRYHASFAFNAPVEASEVHERMMERIVGWDWTDDDGKIYFLEPNREPVYAFEFDQIDDDSQANFVNRSFEKKKRRIADRRNFLLGEFRNHLLSGFPVEYAQGDRDDLRRLTSGVPSNDPATELGVMARSLAERFLEREMVFKSDPTHLGAIAGDLVSSKIRKNQKVTVSYYDTDGNYVANEEYMITMHSWGSRSSQNNFSLLPIPRIFYVDEPITEEVVD